MTTASLTNFLHTTFLSETSLHQSLGEEFSFCDNGNMIFHWADFHETCDVIKAHLESDALLLEDFRKKEKNLQRLELIPVWIRTQSKVYQTTMHNLYEKFLLNQSNLLGVDPFGPIEISFISGTGPFKAMAIAECFNNSTYKDFVLVYLLKGKLPRRDYRVRLKSKVLMEFGHNFEKAHLVQLEQLTSKGLLFSFDAALFNAEVSSQNQLRFLIDSRVLQEASTKALPELQAYLSQFAFNLMYSSRKEDGITCNLADFSAQSSFDFFRNKKVYVFTPFTKLESSNAESIKNIQKFIEHSKALVQDHYKKIANKAVKSA
jgi:hypothetical protein